MGKNLDAELAEAAGLDDDSPVGQASPTREGSSAGEGEGRSAVDSAAVDRAAGEDGASASGMTVPATGAPAPPPPRRGNVGLLAALLTMVSAVVLLFVFGLKEAPIYAMTLAEFMSKGEEMTDRRVRIDGELVPGTLVKRDKPCEFRFTLRDAEKKDVPHLEVRFPQCIVPDTFRDMPEGGVFVTAEGTMKADGYFEANEIMAKCSSKYNPDTHELDGAPKQAQADAL